MYRPKYSGSRAPGASEVVLNNLGGGLNNYLSPISINDNQMSHMQNMYSPDGISLRTIPAIYNYFGDLFSNLSYAYYGFYYPPSLLYSTTDGKAKLCGDTLLSALDISSLNFTVYEDQEGAYFPRQADAYYVYGGARAELLLVKQGGVVGDCVKQAIPKFCQSLCAHQNRIFVASGRTLFWSALGTYNTWYGAPMTEGQMLIDAGFAYIPMSGQIRKVISFRDGLYIFCEGETWLLSGGEPEQWQLSRVISGIGISGYHTNIGVSGGKMFFVDADVVYEYDGYNPPNPISYPVIQGGQVTNGVSGGIIPNKGYAANATFPWNCVADDNYLYLVPAGGTYVSDGNGGMVTYVWIFVFDLFRRTWSKRKIYYNHITPALTMGIFVKAVCINYFSTTVFRVGITYSYGGTVTSINFNDRQRTHDTSSDFVASFATKAFAASPSSNLTLSDIYITWRAESSANNVNLYAYLSDKADPNAMLAGAQDVDWANWTLMKSVVNYNATENMEIMRIQIPHSTALSMESFMRLAIKIVGCDVSIHKIELRYRAKGVSR